jgi:hypothetical protein
MSEQKDFRQIKLSTVYVNKDTKYKWAVRGTNNGGGNSTQQCGRKRASYTQKRHD